MPATVGWPTQAEVDTYTAARANAMQIDPGVAVAVRRSESQTGFIASNGLGGYSWGPFQLDSAGLAPVFRQQTGLDASDPRNWQATVDFALQWAKAHGWSDFHGAARVGITPFQGIGQALSNTLNYFFPVLNYSGNPAATYHTAGAADLFAPIGTAVRAIVQGRVTATGTSGPGGNNIEIHGADGKDYYYAHLKDAPSLTVGQFVTGGSKIGEVGNTGNASNTQPHLHIGIGYGIASGTGPSGGAGIGFDAQTFLSNLLHIGGSGPNPVLDTPDPITPGAITGGIQTGIAGALSSVHQGIIDYVQNRAAAMVLLVAGVFLVLIGVWGFAERVPIVKQAVAGTREVIGAAALVA